PKLMWRILVPHSTQLEKERIATGTPESEAGVRVVRRHHLLVRCSHWLNVPSFWPHPEWPVHLLGISGLSAQTKSSDREFRSSLESAPVLSVRPVISTPPDLGDNVRAGYQRPA